jgi:hypothetical protein
MKHCIYSFALTIVVLAAAGGRADTLSAYAMESNALANHFGNTDCCAPVPASMLTREVPEPSSVLLLAAGLISVALLTTIGRPPFRLKF